LPHNNATAGPVLDYVATRVCTPWKRGRQNAPIRTQVMGSAPPPKYGPKAKTVFPRIDKGIGPATATWPDHPSPPGPPPPRPLNGGQLAAFSFGQGSTIGSGLDQAY